MDSPHKRCQHLQVQTGVFSPRQLDQVYPINWKAFVENSNDDYHVRFVHRRLNSQRKSLETVVRFAGRTCSGYKPHPDGVDLTDGRTDRAPGEHRAPREAAA